MYRLVIAEKPSVAMSIAKVLGATARKEGHMEGGDRGPADGWLVSWCIGHLAGLAEPAAYDPKYDKWRREDLPILPESWRFTIGKDKREQFDILRTLLRREDVSEVVNACDAGREGELIFRTAYHLAGCTKPMKRLWISSMEDSAIREGFENLRPGSDYDGLHQAALCRQKADWLVGINATRLFSVLYGRTLNIGRVMSPTLALIAQREAEIAAFEPVPFYTVELACGGMTLTGERISGKEDAAAIAAACEDSAAILQTVERREKSEKAPALYDLTTLQRDANRILGYTAQETLDYLQALYEKKLCTYPRTDSRYLTDDMENAVPNLVSIAATLCGVKAAGAVSAAQVCSSGKVSDHHAIVPTPSAATVDLASLPLGEREILRLVSLALVRAVCPPYWTSTCRIQHRKQPRGVDAHQPIGLLAAQGGLVQAVIVAAGAEAVEALPDGAVLHAGNPQPFHRLGTARQMVGGAEDQLPLASGVTGVHHLRHILPAQQRPQDVELLPLIFADGKPPVVRQDGQILPPPLVIVGVVDGRLGQFCQMADAPAYQPAAALHVALLPGCGPQHLGNTHGNRGLLRDYKAIHKITLLSNFRILG